MPWPPKHPTDQVNLPQIVYTRKFATKPRLVPHRDRDHHAIAVPAYRAHKLVGRAAIAQRFADCHDVTVEAHIPDKLPRPYLLKQFLLAHDPLMLRQKVG